MNHASVCARCRRPLRDRSAMRHQSGWVCADDKNTCLQLQGRRLAKEKLDAERQARLEDLQWIVETSTDGLTLVAKRLGIRRDSLERWCTRWAPDMLRVLQERDWSYHGRSAA